MSRKPRPTIVCRCNIVARETIEKAIVDGAKTLNEIFDSTSAGVGPCGGSCRREIKILLDEYLASGKFPERKAPATPGGGTGSGTPSGSGNGPGSAG